MKSMDQDWENCYRRGETPWDKGAAAPGLGDFLRENAVLGRVLVPGCGTGHDVRVLAGGGARVVGLDLSPTAIGVAEKFEKVADESFRVGDFFSIEGDLAGSFDWIWEHTCFCAIDSERRPDYVDAAARALRPGGKLLGAFYIDPYDEEHRPGGGPPHGCSVEEIECLFRGLFEIRDSWVPERAYPGREGRERMMMMEKKVAE